MKNSIILILVIGMVALLYSFNNKEENQTEMSSEKRFLITPPPQWIEDDSLNLTQLLIDKTNYYKNEYLDKIFSVDSYFFNKKDFYFIDSENILIVLDHVGYKTKEGKKILKGGIYKINIKTKKVELFDSLSMESAKKEKLFVCSDGLRVLTNNKYKNAEGYWFDIKDKDYPFKSTKINNNSYRDDSCFPTIEDNKYAEYKNNIINPKTQIFKLNNKDLYVEYNYYNNKKNTYTLIKNNKKLHTRFFNYKYAPWSGEVYWTIFKYKQSDLKNENCYGVEYLNLNNKKVDNILFCDGEDPRIQNYPIKVKNGYIFYKRNSSFSGGGNLALYDNDKKFIKYLIDKSRLANIKNISIDSSGCGVLYLEIINKKYRSIKYKNICKDL